MFKKGMYAQNSVIRLHNSCSDLRARPHCETQFRFFPVIDRQSFEHQASETRTSSTTTSMKDHKSLQASAVVRKFANTIKHEIDDFFSNSVMTASKIVCSILL